MFLVRIDFLISEYSVNASKRFVSRAGEKLDAALVAWERDLPPLEGCVCADLGANVGGFTDCLLQRGVARVHAVETGYGVLEWKLRQDERVVVMERTNALHVDLPEPVDLVVADVGWTRQRRVVPAALRMLRTGGALISLVKPQYEADDRQLRSGVLDEHQLTGILDGVRREIRESGATVHREMRSPIRGAGGNTEFLWLIHAAP